MANLFFANTIAGFLGNADTIFVPGDVTETEDPAGKLAAGKKVIRMTVPDDHTAGVTSNPRAQLSTPDFITDGLEYWTATEIYLPVGHPTIKSWLTFHVPAWGPPFGGSGAPVHAEASYDRCTNWERTALYSYDGPIEGPSPWPRGEWVQVIYHIKHATAGWVEMWINGKQVTFFEPGHSYNPGKHAATTKLEMQTRQAGTNNEGNNHAAISYYRQENQYEVGTAYFKGLSVATTKEDLKLAELAGGSEGGGEEEEGGGGGGGASPYREAIEASAPVAYYRLGDATSTALDISGNNFHGIYENGPTLGQTGALAFDTDKAVKFGGPGTNQRMEVSEHAALKLGDTFSYEMWFKRGGKGTEEVLLANPGAAATGKVIITSENKLRLRAAGTGNIMTTAAKVEDEAWHHLVVTKSGSSSAKIYLDGVDVGGTVTNFTVASGNVFQVANEGNEFLYKGSLDELSIYGRALTAKEVEEHYAAAFIEPPPEEEEEPEEEGGEEEGGGEEEEPPPSEEGEGGEEEPPPAEEEGVIRAPTTTLPKLAVPVVFNGADSLTAVEQDSDEEVANCVYVIAGTPVGTRVDNLEFGIPDPLFDTLPLEDDEILQAIERFEPRARVRDEQDFEEGFGRLRLNVDGP